MPNWTWNRIACKKSIADKILTKTEKGYSFDFNKLIKMPEDLDIESGSMGQNGLMYLYLKSKDDLEKIKINDAYKSCNPFFNDIYREGRFGQMEENPSEFENESDFKESVELGKKYLSNYEKYGHCTWYNWCIDNWGTKWNVGEDVDVEIDSDDECIITFNTAWSPPRGIIIEYSKLCKDDEFDWEYENEDYDGHHILRKEDGIILDNVIDCDEDISDDIEV